MAEYDTGSDGGPKKTDAQTLCDTIRENIQVAWEHDRDNRHDQASDVAFFAGDQWPEDTRREREDSSRPMLTINRLPQFVRQVTNDIRQADLSIKVKPVGDGDDEEMADIYNGLLRQIHYKSAASHVYAKVCEDQCIGGLGWFRVVTDYEDEDTFNQEIKIEQIRNPLGVYVDPAAVKPTREDAMWIAVTQEMPRETFKTQYPKASQAEIHTPHDRPDSWLFWSQGDTVKIAEYWWKTPVKYEIGMLEDGRRLNLTEMRKDLTDAGITYNESMLGIVKKRMVTTHKVQSCICNGHEVLEGPFDWPGKHIPLVAVVGGEVAMEKRNYRFGIIRFARDSQLLYNYARTAMAESIGNQPKAPFVATMKQIKRYLGIWNSAGKANHPYLPFDHDPDAPGPPQRVAPPQMAPGLTEEAATCAEDMKATTGIYDAALGARSNETSGKAILARDHQGDVANFHFIDNLKHAMNYAGRIIVDLVPKIYDNQRVMRLLGDDDSEKPVVINQHLYNNGQQPVIANDLSKAKFDVRVSIGKSYSTMRMEKADTLVSLAQAYPPLWQMAGDLLIKAIDIPEGEQIAERLKRSIPPQILGPEEAEESGIQPPQPDPMEIAAAEAEIAGKQADVAKTQADTRKTNIEADRAEVEGAMAVASMMTGQQPAQQYQ